MSVKHKRTRKLTFGMYTDLQASDFMKPSDSGDVIYNAEKLKNMKEQAQHNASRLFLIHTSAKLLCKAHGLKLVTDVFPNKECVLACGCRRPVATPMTAKELSALQRFEHGEQERIEKLSREIEDGNIERLQLEQEIVPAKPDPFQPSVDEVMEEAA